MAIPAPLQQKYEQISKKVIIESKTNDIAVLEEEEKKISQIKDKEIRNKAEKKHKAKVVVNTVIRNVITTKVVQKPSDLRTAKIKEKVIFKNFVRIR